MTKLSRKKPWFPLELATLPNCRYIACDPSITALGLVFLEVHDGEVYILGAEKLSAASTGKVGWEDTFERAKAMESLVGAVLTDWLHDYGDARAVNESPPIGTGPMMRIEATILTGYGFGRQAERLGATLESMVMPRSHKWLLCGNAAATKIQHHAEIRKLLPDIIDGKMITNEATRDALSVALFAADRRRS